METMHKPVILTPEEIEAKLKEVEGWRFADDKISKEFKFQDFMDSLKFVNGLAPFFESMDHHPDTHIMYSKVLFELHRFDVGGKVTDLDFILATELDRRYAERTKT